MRTIVASVLYTLLAVTLCEARKPRCTLRAHVEANSHDGPTFSTQFRSPTSGKNVVIQKMPTVSERDVTGFAPYQANDGSYGVLIQLDKHGTLALDSLSIERRGTMLFVFINGRLVTELRIDRRVSDGRIYLPSGLTPNDLALMKKEWRLIGQRKK